jgi:hypothetical protein
LPEIHRRDALGGLIHELPLRRGVMAILGRGAGEIVLCRSWSFHTLKDTRQPAAWSR